MNEQVLAVRGVGGYRQYRIPAMAVTPSGRIITIYDARADFDDLPGPVDLVIRTSDDNGFSWSKQRIFREHEGISGYGDASIIVDPTFGSHGRVIVLYQWTRIAGFFESALGNNVDDPLIAHIARSISDDDGLTWRHDLITDHVKDAKTPGIFATSGMGGRVSSGRYEGRLLQTFVLRRENELLAAIGFSDDHGETWRLGALIPGGNETAITGVRDGSILIHSRSTPYRLAGRSIDGGETLTSLEADTALPDPSDNGSLCTLKNGDLLCSHNHDSDLRRNTVLKRSTDNGFTWTSGVCIEADSSAYSTACELADGTIGVLYERNAYQEIVFKKFSERDFQPLEKICPVIKHEDDIEFLVVPRFIRPARDHVIEKMLINAPSVPEVDMSGFKVFERKEVGTAGGSTSGDSLFTTEELDKILGEITPGLHLNDEIRFSARVSNLGQAPVKNLKIINRNQEIVFESKLLEPNSKLCELDIRELISIEDLEGLASRFTFEASGEMCDADTLEISEFKKTVTLEMLNK